MQTNKKQIKLYGEYLASRIVILQPIVIGIYSLLLASELDNPILGMILTLQILTYTANNYTIRTYAPNVKFDEIPGAHKFILTFIAIAILGISLDRLLDTVTAAIPDHITI